MLLMTAIAAPRPTASPMMSALYAAIATAIAAVAVGLLFQAEIVWLYLLAFLLIGAAPVIGYQLATGTLGTDWKPLIGGALGYVLLILGWILWPILVGIMTKGQSVGKLFAASLGGIILGFIVFLILGSIMGQDPSWVMIGWTAMWAIWGATVGAAMVAWGDPA